MHTDTHQHVSCFECGFALFLIGLKPNVPDVHRTGVECCTCGRDILIANLNTPAWLDLQAADRSN